MNAVERAARAYIHNPHRVPDICSSELCLMVVEAEIYECKNKACIVAYRVMAEERFRCDDIEIDDDADVSICDDGKGAYVAAWVWIPVLEDEDED